MKKNYWLALVFILAINTSVNASINSDDLVKYAEQRNTSSLTEIFHNCPSLSLSEARKVFKDLVTSIEDTYQVSISPAQLKAIFSQIIPYYFDPNDSEFILGLLDAIYSEESTINTSFSGFYNYNSVSSQTIILCKKSKSNSPTAMNGDIPGGVIVGGLETLAGALLWIFPPTRPVGTGLMVDGVRRMLNEVEESDKKSKQC